ncbi:DMT family transporter [Methylobacterium sp. ID0610]|uniref:DMT family transporter n=1 Tax=Methylobacterium carpenticola TaxID=3344827 RepID=UPI0036C0F3C4
MTSLSSPAAQGPSTRDRSFLAGVGWALLAVTIWGGWFVVTRRTVGSGSALGPADLVAIRFGCGGLILLPVALRLRRLTRRDGIDAAWLILGQGAPFALLISIALRYAPAGHGAALTPGTMPLMAAVLGMLVLGDRPGRTALAGLALILAGALALAGAAETREEALGYGLFLTAALLWAIGTVRMRRSALRPVEATALICVVSLVGYVPAYLALGLSHIAAAPLGEVALQVAYQGVLVSVVGLIAFNRSLALIGRRTPAFTALVPVIATLLAIPVLGEIPSLASALAVAAIGLGVLLTTRG